MSRLLTCLRISEHVSIFLSVITNTVLITLILMNNQMKLGSYKHFMILCCVVQLLYSCTNVIAKTNAHSTNISYVLFREFHEGDRSMAPLSLLLFCGLYTTQIAILSIQFLYRYIYLWHPHHLRIFDRNKFCFWLLGVFLFGAFVPFLKYNFLEENDSLTNELREDFKNIYGFSMNEVVYNGAIYYKCNDSLNCVRPVKIWLTAATLVLSVMICFISIIFFGSISFIRIRTALKLSDQMREQQQQLLRALFIQATIPCIFIYIPSEILFITPMFGVGLGEHSNIPMIMMTIYPAVEQIGVIYVIKDFRIIIKRWVTRTLTRTSDIS